MRLRQLVDGGLNDFKSNHADLTWLDEMGPVWTCLWLTSSLPDNDYVRIRDSSYQLKYVGVE